MDVNVSKMTSGPVSLTTSMASPRLTSPENFTEEERLRYLSDLDILNFPYMVPAVVYLSILMVVGIAGNILVLVVYLKKFKQSPTRVFVLALAVFDLMACVISLPGEILDLRYTYTFNYIHICRILRFNNTFSVIASGFILIAVSVDRYRKICKPLQKQISTKVSRIIVVIAVSVALVLSIPTIIVNGRSTVQTDKAGITGVDCSFDDRWSDTLFPLAYTGVFFLSFTGSLVVLIVMYILIGRTVFIHRKFNFHPKSNFRNQSSQNSTSETELSSGDGKGKTGKKHLVTNGKTSENGVKVKRLSWISSRKTKVLIPVGKQQFNGVAGSDEPSEWSQSYTSDSDDTLKKPRTVIFTRRPDPTSNGIILTRFTKSENKRKGSTAHTEERKISKPSKTTLMLFIITAVFIVSFLPHLILMITRGFKPDFLDSLQGVGKMAYNVCLRSYFINSAANCIVYSFCNVKFRNECRKLLCRCMLVRK